ncbi:MAG: TonB-dependent receptor [Bacteroidetes bacterium]|jgi:iron complex outermembrane receptor protein|nr:TonB-dependent receptor [Bacteroidota bacterium]
MPLFRLCALTVLLVAPGLAWGQTGTVRGTITDAEGTPLPGVNVVVQGTTLGAASSSEGVYVLPRVPTGPQTLVASAVGFASSTRSITVPPADTLTVHFTLQEALIAGEEVVVTAARREQSRSRAPVSLAVISPEALMERSVVSLDDALRHVPGVQMADNQINVRGSSGFSYNTGSRVLLLLDGMPLLRPDSEGVPFDTLPLDQIARVEVIKGPGSALYGGNALGGVINVLTRDFPETPETTLRLRGGAYEPVRHATWRAAWDEADAPRFFGGATITHARQLSDRLGFWSTVSYRTDAGYLHYQKERDLDAYAKLGWQAGPGTRLAVLAGWTRRTSDSFLYWNGLDDPLNPGNLGFLDTGSSTPAGTNDNRSDTVTLLPSLTHVVTPSLFVTLKGRLYGAAIRPIDESGEPRSLDDGTAGVRYGGEVQVDWQPTGSAYLTAGVSGDALATESSFFQEDDAERQARSQPEAAAFAQWEQSVGERLTLTAGARYDVYYPEIAGTERKLSPKGSIALTLSPQLTLRAAVGQGFRVPSLAERYVSNSSFLPLIPNLDLRPEESTGYEAGVRGMASQRGLSLEYDLALFQTDYRRLVEPTFLPERRAFQFVNLTRARVRGAEATATLEPPSARWHLQAGYTVLDADDLSADQPLVFRSRHLVKASARASLHSALTLGVDLRVASAFERVDSDFARFVPDADEALPIRVVDGHLAVRWRAYQLTLRIENLLDYYYVERPAILAPPRHATLQLIARW